MGLVLRGSCMSNHLSNEKCTLVIPARRRSTRLPDKLLLRQTGKTVLQHTYEAACQTRRPTKILIATDDREIAAEARRFGAEVVMTSVDCPSGTDRVAEAVRNGAFVISNPETLDSFIREISQNVRKSVGANKNKPMEGNNLTAEELDALLGV